jgi:hypothetical protein
MKRYLISYDLMTPGKDYAALTQTLQSWGAKRVLLSAWVLKTTSSAVQVRDALRTVVDPNDRVLVVALTGEAAWTTLLIDNASAVAMLNG